ncbi:hypothetical protein FB471_1103 [Amycolatopsis cihanbeyliensis]|uniref:Uncharacterized protein n=1 Tax=Amycolatopsis cihanbeyliensis TaxID=1128664 RepID=A0A542DED2_AMYCI|nr:hypothetical protein FB471_1103 [Amycolatopsis cihanbeyliensis]
MLHHESRAGAIKVARLIELGVPSRTAYRRCVPGGPWQRPLPGIVLLNNGHPTRRQLVEAALLYAGEGAIVTGAEACRRHGLTHLPDDSSVHLLIPEGHRINSSDYVLIERTIHLPQPTMRDGVPLAPLVRAVLDICRRLRDFDLVRALLAEAVQRGRADPYRIQAELENGCQRGTAVPRDVLRSILRGARSVAEGDAMRVWERTGLPPFEWNVELRDDAGRYIATPDGWCGEVGLAWEIDSYDFHFARKHYSDTIERNSRYNNACITLVQTLPTKLRSDPQAVAKELIAAYHTAAARPRPTVHTITPAP